MNDPQSTPARKPSKWVEVGGSGIHQNGLFAKRDIPKKTRLIEYFGEKVPKREAQRRGYEQDEKGRPTGDGTVYIFNLNSRYDLDGAIPDNDAKYINHSCDPNAYVEVKKNHIWIHALRDIKKGEEITYDYNFDVEHYEEYPCRCGSANCVGYIVGGDYWKELKRLIRKKAKTKAGTKAGTKERKSGKK